ncbi:MAG: hypothetical protein HZB12_00020 [Candidatus Yonathbacteria bacterium]|nr:hypothetical protein [Candidatus Yonathbacteria bacterium]
MEMETTSSPSGKKTFLKIALGVLVIILVLATTAFILTEQKNAMQVAPQEEEPTQPAVLPPHVYTDEEKRQALEDFAKHASTSILSETEKLFALKKFSVKASTTTFSDEEKRKALIDFATRIPLAP